VLHPEAPDSYLANTKADPDWEWTRAPEIREALKPQVARVGARGDLSGQRRGCIVKEHIIATVIVYDETESLVEIVGFNLACSLGHFHTRRNNCDVELWDGARFVIGFKYCDK